MNRIALFLSTLLLACGHPGRAPAQEDPEKNELRRKLTEAHLKILELELDKARAGGNRAEELKILLATLGSEFSEVRGAAFRELGNLPEEVRKAAVPEVLRLYKTRNESFKIRSITFLGRVPSPEAEAAVLAAAGDPSAPIRRAAAASLKSASSEGAVQALVGLLKDPDGEVKLAAIDALGIPKREAAVRPLTERISAEKEDAILEKLAAALGVISSPQAVDALLALLKETPRDGIRWYCIDSLGRIGDARAADPLRPFLAPAYERKLREAAIVALGKMKDTASLPRLAEILRADPEEMLRREAAQAIGTMAPVESIHSVLLPAYLNPEEKSESVQRAIWEAILALAADYFEPHETAASVLLKRGRRAEAEQLCVRLHSLKVSEAAKARYLTLEEAVARGAYEAGDFRNALVHYRQMAGLAPNRADLLRRLGRCYREVGDLDNALKSLREADGNLPKGDAAWWENRLEILGLLEKGKDPEPQIEEAYALLSTNPPPHPEERRKLLEESFRSGILRLLQLLGDREEATRKAALQSVQRVGRKIVPVLAAELEGEPKAPGPAIEAGNALTGTAYDPATRDPAKLKQIAADWRAWLLKPK